MRFFRENRFLIIGIFIISALFAIFSFSIDRKTFVATYSDHGILIDGDWKAGKMVVYHPKSGDTISFSFDKYGMALLSDCQVEPVAGGSLIFDVNHDGWKSLGSDYIEANAFRAYAASINGNDVFTIDQYLDERRAQLTTEYFLRFFQVICILLLIDWIRRNSELIIEYLDRFTRRVNTVLDPTKKYSKEVQEYIGWLNNFGYQGRILKTSIIPRLTNRLHSGEYILTQNRREIIVPIIFQLVLLIAMPFLGVSQRQLLFLAIMTFILVLIAILGLSVTKPKLILNQDGIQVPHKLNLNWDNIEHTFLAPGNKGPIILVKQFGILKPIEIEIHNLSRSPRQIAHLVQKFRGEKHVA